MNKTGVTGLTAKKKTLSMRVFGPRNSAYAINLTYETYRQHIISREISIEHPSVGLASLAQLFSNKEIIDFCQCAEITHYLTAKYPIAVSKKCYRGLLRVNQERKVLEVCVVSTVEF